MNKREQRQEAIERLRKYINYTVDYRNAAHAILGDKYLDITGEECIRSIIDLLTDDDDMDGYLELPKDVNGKVVHIGDEMVCGDHVFTVNGIGWEHGRGEVFYMTEDGCDVCTASLCRHRKPTVEDVLLGFVIALDKRMHLSNGVATTIAEYAPKLQVKEDE